ncbi:MAG: hypothetical protein ABIB43_05920 [archaeon]
MSYKTKMAVLGLVMGMTLIPSGAVIIGHGIEQLVDVNKSKPAELIEVENMRERIISYTTGSARYQEVNKELNEKESYTIYKQKKNMFEQDWKNAKKEFNYDLLLGVPMIFLGTLGLYAGKRATKEK